MPVFHEMLKKLDNNIEATVVIPKHFTKEDVNELYGNLTGFKTAYNAHKTLYSADFAFICSGTATLEAALIGTPFVLSYIAKPLDYFIVSKLVKLSYAGLGNIMFTQFNEGILHPELIQKEVTVANLLREYKALDRDRFLEDSKHLRAYLKQGSSKTVASIIEDRNAN
jgi:lipid-A-disaccharide synthase